MFRHAALLFLHQALTREIPVNAPKSSVWHLNRRRRQLHVLRRQNGVTGLIRALERIMRFFALCEDSCVFIYETVLIVVISPVTVTLREKHRLSRQRSACQQWCCGETAFMCGTPSAFSDVAYSYVLVVLHMWITRSVPVI